MHHFSSASTKLLVATLAFSASIFAQSFQGSLRGRIVDPNGAATPGANITLTDEGTSVARKTVSNDIGEFNFAAVNPSTYRITVEAQGFKMLERRAVAVATQSNVTLDLKLEIGQVSEKVDVTSEAPVLQTADASTGQVIDAQKITDLPILGRNPFFMAKLAETVVLAGNVKFARMQDQNGNAQVSIAGGPIRTNNYLLDGISITDATNRAVILPSPEAVQEMKLQASTYDAEVGRTGGGTFNTILKSGTNDIHGSAVGHIRQTSWLANTFFANAGGQPIPDQPFRDWAASLGGPIRIPHVYDGRNKTFFFITTEAYRQKDATSASLIVPTDLERVGDFSQSFVNVGGVKTLQTIYDPLSTASDGTRTPIPGNKLQPSQLSTAGLAIASYFPHPNLATPSYQSPNYSSAVNYPNRGDQSTWKADHTFTDWLRMAGSYVHQKTFETAAQGFSNIASPGQGLLYRKIDATQANAIMTPQPTMVVAVRWGFNRFYSRSAPASAGFDLATIGLGNLKSITPNTAFPAITIGAAATGCGTTAANEFTGFGGGCTNQDVWYSRSLNTSVSKFMGAHSLKAGWDFRVLHDAGTPPTGPTSLGFTDVFTRKTPQATTAGTGSSLASLLMGYPASGQMTVTTKLDDFVRYYGFFVHDDYRMNSKLTLNFGVRFEHESGIQEVNNNLVTGFNRTAVNPLQAQVPSLKLLGAVQYAGQGGPTQSGDPKSIKLGPRFGFAYTFDNKTVVRGGYGIFWAPAYYVLQNALGYTQNTPLVATNNNGFTPAPGFSLSNLYPNGLIQPSGNKLGAASGIGQSFTLPDPTTGSGGYVQQFSFDVQREVGGGFVFTLGFLGSHSLHLIQSGQNINQLDPSKFALGSALNSQVTNPFYQNGGVGILANATVARAQLELPFPQYGSIQLANAGSGAATYYAVYFRGERHLRNGISILGSYTYSRSMDDLVGQSLAGTNQIASPAGPQNAYSVAGEWGLSLSDAPSRLTTAVTYELPFGKGKRFLANSKFLDLAVGGWSFNAIGVIQSGYPLTITEPNNNSGIGATYQRPNATGTDPTTSGSVTDRVGASVRWINKAAFSTAPQFSFGNVARGIPVRGPSLYNWDMSVFKTFSIKERIKAQFRAEALNATNTVYFGPPNTTFTNASFGLITTQNNNPRLMQLGFRVTF